MIAMYANVYVPNGHEAEFHVMFGQWLATKSAATDLGSEDDDTNSVEKIIEGGLLKRPWDASDEAVEAAKWMLQSVVEKAHPLLKAFVYEPNLRTTQDLLAGKVGWPSGTVKSHRNLFGKQAWRAGEWANPISSEKTDAGERVYFMRPATVQTLVQAGL